MNKKTALACALSIALVASPLLAACGNSSNQQPASEATTSDEESKASELDMKSWQTLGDALEHATGSLSWGSNDKYIVCVFEADDALVRAVGEMEPGVDEKMGEVDFFADDHDEQIAQIIGVLKLESAEDLSGDIPSQEELDALVGKTGQQLQDDGYAFESYYMYGGDETSAIYAHGFIGVDVTFDTTISEEDADGDENGDALKDAVVTAAEYAGPAGSALDPEFV